MTANLAVSNFRFAIFIVSSLNYSITFTEKIRNSKVKSEQDNGFLHTCSQNATFSASWVGAKQSYKASEKDYFPALERKVLLCARSLGLKLVHVVFATPVLHEGLVLRQNERAQNWFLSPASAVVISVTIAYQKCKERDFVECMYIQSE